MHGIRPEPKMTKSYTVNILAEREIGKKVHERSLGGGFGVWHY